MRFRGAVVALTAVFVLAFAGSASADIGLNAYKAKARGAAELRELKRQGFDITEGQRRGGIEIIATKRQIAKLRRAGVSADADPRPPRADLAPGGGRAGGRRLEGLAAVRAHRHRAVGRLREPHRQHQDAAGEAGQPPSRHREARDDRAQHQRPADLCDEGHEGRARPQGRQAPRGPLLARSSTRASGSRARPGAARFVSSSTTTAATEPLSEPTASPSRVSPRGS